MVKADFVLSSFRVIVKIIMKAIASFLWSILSKNVFFRSTDGIRFITVLVIVDSSTCSIDIVTV